jgi:bacteriocin biosynthesis cyclodehydratase domain-containing protein
MVLRLDPRFAVVWRDPFSLQLGVEPGRVVLRDVSPAEERMIAALESGVSRSGLDMIATTSGAPQADVPDLLRRLKPLLLADEPPIDRSRICLVGAGPTVERIAHLLALTGAQVSVTASVPSDAEEACDLGIVVGHYVLDPESYGYWLRRDVPHLPVIFGDDSAAIGPLVDPGVTPCLYCLEHYRRDADASWAAIASQLWGRRARSETPLVSTEVASRVVRLVLARLTSGRPTARALSGRSRAARAFRLAIDSGEVTRRDWMPHPDCGCVALPDSVSADPRETDSAGDSDLPMTVATAVERA